MINYDDDVCTMSTPDTIRFYNTTFTSELRATCTECEFVSMYWECNCELEHNCDDHR